MSRHSGQDQSTLHRAADGNPRKHSGRGILSHPRRSLVSIPCVSLRRTAIPALGHVIAPPPSLPSARLFPASARPAAYRPSRPSVHRRCPSHTDTPQRHPSPTCRPPFATCRPPLTPAARHSPPATRNRLAVSGASRASLQFKVMSASAKPRLAGRQPFHRDGVPRMETGPRGRRAASADPLRE